jgi:hypothetical protein
LDWIESLGVIKTCNDVSNKENFDKNFDLLDTKHRNFHQWTHNKLKYIENNRSKEQIIIKSSNIGNIEMTNEIKCNLSFPNEKIIAY